MTGKKKLVELLQEIYRAQEEERKAKNENNQSATKKQWHNKNLKVDTFNNYVQRTYDYADLEKKLLGLDA